MLNLSVSNQFHIGVLVLAAAMLLVGSACAGLRDEVVRENKLLLSAELASDSDDLEAVQGIEVEALKAAGVDADRKGDSLIIRLAQGSVRIFKDRPECEKKNHEAKCQKYKLIVHARSRGVFVVAKLYYESAEYILVDDTSGDETVLRGFPIFSPSGRYVLVLLMNDEKFGFAVQIWRRAGHKFVLDWQGAPNTDGMYTNYKFLSWPSENTIDLQSETRFGLLKLPVTKHFFLHLTAHGWNVVEIP